MEAGAGGGGRAGAGARIRSPAGAAWSGCCSGVASALLYWARTGCPPPGEAPAYGRLYHAWLAAVVIFGPSAVPRQPRTIFASHGLLQHVSPSRLGAGCRQGSRLPPGFCPPASETLKMNGVEEKVGEEQSRGTGAD